MSKIQNFIGGKFQESPPNSYIPSENPATKQVLYQIPNSTENEANLAITAADAAFKTWSKTKYPTRAKYLQKIADMLQENLEYFAKIESQDMGKTLKFATSCDISGCIGILNRFIRRLHTSKSEIFSRNDVNPDDESETSECLHYTYKTPLGPCTIITPWNYPLYTVINKLAPCVAYGNTCVIKPSEYTSGTSFEFCKKLLGINQAWNQEHDAKLNVDGVINFVFGLGPYVGSKLCSDFRIKAVGFTGSTATAQKVNIAAAGTLKKVGLECGGKNPALVFADANLDQAVVTLKEACFGNNGQICVNTERVYVEESIFDQFLEKIVKLGEDLVVNQFGDPMEESTFIGPLVGKFHYEKVSGMVDRAIDDDSVAGLL